ncbi:MAG: hypothetical protein HC824_01435 [Synechococcales cyanobacterium RM1_1_8]|nr:hypothetical protein [Synechococcales cyanobacterium RM1_1_8]
MSEYQVYEFQAIDRPLSAEDREYLHSLSSRAQVGATSARYTYSFGDFRHQPEEVLDRCFDMMLYIANFGVRRLVLRLPSPAAASRWVGAEASGTVEGSDSAD